MAHIKAEPGLIHFEESVNRVILKALSALEKLVLVYPFISDQPQLYILGLPRSGTTLVYQYIVHRLQVAYLTNGVGNYPGAPSITTFIQKNLNPPYQSDFKSHYGKVEGAVAPREAGVFWGRFFDLNEYVSFSDVPKKKARQLQKTIACVQQIYGNAPFVNKNVKHLLRIDALGRIFPNSSFLVVERKLPEVALSVLRGRYENLENPAEWWSVRPPNYSQIKDLCLVEQVAYQLVSLTEKMNADLKLLPAERCLRIQYSDFCQKPEQVIDKLRQRWPGVAYRNEAQEQFQQSKGKAKTAEEEELLELVLELSAHE